MYDDAMARAKEQRDYERSQAAARLNAAREDERKMTDELNAARAELSTSTYKLGEAKANLSRAKGEINRLRDKELELV